MADIYIELKTKADGSARKIAKEILKVTKAFPKVRFRVDTELDNVVTLTGNIPRKD